MNRYWKAGVFILILAVAASIAYLAYNRQDAVQDPVFRTIAVKRGDLSATISATGTVEPEEVVDVGAQVAGKIVALGKDSSGKPVDYGSPVEAGMVLAKIDDSLYSADVSQARAQFEQARAGVLRSEADLVQLQAKLTQAERDWSRARKLGASDALSQADYDAAQSAFDVARANVGVGKAALAQAKGSMAAVEAGLQRAQLNLDYCTIKSPVKGVIIDRRVNIGQTVVSSLNAPSLFLIAKDLRRMQVWVSVNEADIGSIHPSQPVTFTADAYPGAVFSGEVGKVRLNASMTQNVVNYIVEVMTDNSDGRLLPYLTANVKFLVSSRRQVLLVPNAALRWTPTPEMTAPEGGEPSRSSSATDQTADGSGDEYSQGVVWVPSGSLVKAVAVGIGPSDGTLTEIQSRDIADGMQVVVATQVKQASEPSQTGSPFTPKFFGRGRNVSSPRH